MRLPVCLALAGALFLTAGCKRAQTPADENPPPAPAKFETARQLFLEEWVDLVGTTQPLPDKAARVTAAVEGRVLSLLKDKDGKPATKDGNPVAEGQEVPAGTPIVQLDATIVRTTRDKLAAGQKVLKTEIDQAESGVKLASIKLKGLKGLQANDDTRGGGPTVGRMPLVSTLAIEEAEVALEDAKSKVETAKFKLEAGDKELAALNEQLQLYTLAAPIKGKLGRLLVVPGQTLAIGAPVTDVVDVSEQIDVLCFVPAQIARKLKVGQTAQVIGSEGGDSSGPQGKVEFIAEQAEPDTGNFAVKVRFPNSEAKLPVNAVMQLRVQTHEGKPCLAIPESALMEDTDPPTVVVVQETDKKFKNDKGEMVPVYEAIRLKARIGLRDRVKHAVEILGLDDPEKKWHGNVEEALFVTEKGQGLQNDDKVRLEEEDE
jgi:multidrug efflux pump subunit AcrA (membrane-fusion protein)